MQKLTLLGETLCCKRMEWITLIFFCLSPAALSVSPSVSLTPRISSSSLKRSNSLVGEARDHVEYNFRSIRLVYDPSGSVPLVPEPKIPPVKYLPFSLRESFSLVKMP